MPASGTADRAFGAGGVVAAGAWSTCVGLVVGRCRRHRRLEPLGGGRRAVCYGFGTGVWDVAMNVEGAGGRAAARPQHHAALPRRLVASARSPAPGSAPCAAGARRTRWPCTSPSSRRRSAVIVAVVASRSRCVPAGEEPRTPTRPPAVGLAGAAHAGDRRHGAGLHPRRGRRPTTGWRSRWSTGTTRRHWVGVARLRALRGRDDARPAGRTGRAGPVRPGSVAARLGAGGDRRRADRRLAGRAGARRRRHRALGARAPRWASRSA